MKRICAFGTWTAAIAATLGWGSVASAQPSVALAASTQSAGSSVSTLHFFIPGPDSTQPPQPSDVAQIPSLRRSIALDLHGVTREQALEEIGHTGGLSVVYASDVIPRSGSVVLVNPAITIGAALEAVLGGLPLDVLLESNGTIILTKRAAPRANEVSLRVQITDQLSRRPVEGALVSLLAPDGATVTEGLTDAHGIRLLSAASPGRYRVRVRRIGFVPFTSDALELAVGEITPLALTIPSTPITLPTVTTTAKPKACKRGEGEQLASSALWDQIRIALEASELTQSDTSVGILHRNFDRGIPTSGTRGWLNAASQSLARDQGYVAPRSAADLSLHGYVVTTADGNSMLAGPDAQVLLSPEFENDHCFTRIAGAGPTAGLIGLSFAPVADRTVADISGVLWVAPPSARLEYVDYRYENFHPPGRASEAGGHVVFERLPNGEWIVQDWTIHTPNFVNALGAGLRNVTSLTGYHDVGGRSESVAIAPAESAPSGASATLTDPLALGGAACPESTTTLNVTVYDTSTSSALASELTAVAKAKVEVNWFEPIAVGGARVAVGLPQVAETDASGTASLCLLRHAGQPIAVAYAARSTSKVVAVATGGGGPLTLRLPIERGILLVSYLPSGSSRVDLVVRDAQGAPIEGAVVEVNGWRYTPETSSRSGHLSISDLPSGTAIVDVWRPGYARQRLAVDLAPKKTQAIEIRLVSDAVAIGAGGEPPKR